MKADNFVLEDYFDRIGLSEAPAPDAETIAKMMRRQLFTVPFENIDVQAGKIVSLVPEEIVDKIINRRRGGYCYEVNGLFAMALEALGVPYQFVAARPMFYPVRRPKTHVAIVLTLNGERWLCDLGFGSYGIRGPLSLNVLDVGVQQDFDTFMLSSTGDGSYLLKALVAGHWENQYAFDLSPQEWIDFTPANYLNSTHPDAIFVQKLLVILHNEAGRDILLGDVLKTVRRDRTEQQILALEERDRVLASRFGLELKS